MSQSRAPKEFRYWEHLAHPRAQRLRAVGRRLLGFDPAPDPNVVDTIGSMYFDADPLAEAFVDEAYLARSSAEGRALLDEAIESGTAAMASPPQSLVDLFADIETEPSWVDHEMVELGAKVFRRYGTDVFRFAGTITLAAYSENSVAKPLALTGGYAGKSAQRRFLETAAFWIAVSAPGGLRAGAPGRASALRVRIMHVFVRRRLLSHSEWDLDAWGVPISQADALLTLMGGSFAPALGLRLLGYRTTNDEILALMHFWRYVGHLMGVRPRWYPSTLRDAWQLSFVTAIKGVNRAGRDGTMLCQSYVNAFAPVQGSNGVDRWFAEIGHRRHLAMTRLFLPPHLHRRHELPGAGVWTVAPLLELPIRFVAETVRQHISAADRLADRVASESRRRWFARYMGDRAAEYRPVEHFTR